MSSPKELIASLLQEEGISVLQEEDIQKLSCGAIINHETINLRTGNPERGGILCSKIFGPVEDYCCLCGKYDGEKYIGVTCEKCGVMVASSSVRDTRCGHLVLAAPIPHPLFFSVLAEQLSIEEGILLQVLSGERLAWIEGERLQTATYEEWLASLNKKEMKDVGAILLELANKAPGSAWLSARGLRVSELLLRSFPVVPPGLRPGEWRPRPSPLFFDEGHYKQSFYESLSPVSLGRLKERARLLATHESVVLGINRRYQALIQQNEQLAHCIQYEAPTQIIVREYAALCHCVHSFFWVGKDSLIKLFLANQDTNNEEVALYGLALVRR